MENTDLPLYIINSKIMKYYIINNVAYRCRHRLNSYTLINISHDNSPNSNICILRSLKQETTITPNDFIHLDRPIIITKLFQIYIELENFDTGGATVFPIRDCCRKIRP